MKILILCTKLPWPAKEGGAIASLNLAVGLADVGCRVTFLAMNTSRHFMPPEKIPEEIRYKTGIRAVDVDTRLKAIPLLSNYLFSTYPYNAQRFVSRDFRKAILDCLGKVDFDIVQLEGPYLESYIPVIRSHSSAKIALRAHNLEHRIWAQAALQEQSALKKLYIANLAVRVMKLEKRLLGNADLLVPISGDDASRFRELNSKIPVHVTFPGLNIGDYPLNDVFDTLKLFYIGALDWEPNRQGLDWFFSKVWPEISSKWPDMQMALAGRDAGNYPGRGTLPGNVSPEGEPEDAISFFRQYNVMIVPLLSGSGVRIKIIEAMAMGKVVVSTATGASGLKTLPGEHLFIANTPGEFVQTIQLLMDQPMLIGSVGENARKFVMENFDNLAIARNLVSFYKEACR